ncbi:Spindle pole body component 110 [Frankliniella fusca]|uniref:Spindle pole body component 110 n=1 Tax=Frankliniella fusca TaxID=407009 RepID=A0AAE1GXZ5_9NEOP|nr:Spindle pole body component 110 [Frankliniella fusca]
MKVVGKLWEGKLLLGEDTVIDEELIKKNEELMEEIRKEVVEDTKNMYNQNALRYNLRRRDVEFKKGQLVYRKNHVKSDKLNYFNQKLAPKYIGPFRKKDKIGYNGYLLETETRVEDGPWHVGDLKESPGSDFVSR